jgi:DNA-binding Xre family transcriptional regulator
MDVNWKLREKCTENNIWTVAELQRLLQTKTGLVMTQQGVGKLMRGQPAAISMKSLYALCYVLNCTPNDLLTFNYSSLENFNTQKQSVKIAVNQTTSTDKDQNKILLKNKNIPLPPF